MHTCSAHAASCAQSAPGWCGHRSGRQARVPPPGHAQGGHRERGRGADCLRGPHPPEQDRPGVCKRIAFDADPHSCWTGRT